MHVYSARVTSGRPQTIAELRAGGHRRETVKQEMRRNLLTRLRAGEPLLAGIVGYEETVLPQLANAIISGHDVIMLGERGQAKSRIMRSLISLLDEEVPVIAGCEVNDHPFDPICRRCLDMIAKDGDNVDVYLMTIGDEIAGLAVVSAEPKEFTVVNIVGPINLEKLSQLEGSFGVPFLNLPPPKPKTGK